jgi:hypothetical protein
MVVLLVNNAANVLRLVSVLLGRRLNNKDLWQQYTEGEANIWTIISEIPMSE